MNKLNANMLVPLACHKNHLCLHLPQTMGCCQEGKRSSCSIQIEFPLIRRKHSIVSQAPYKSMGFWINCRQFVSLWMVVKDVWSWNSFKKNTHTLYTVYVSIEITWRIVVLCNIMNGKNKYLIVSTCSWDVSQLLQSSAINMCNSTVLCRVVL
jgi:hypothetical protein